MQITHKHQCTSWPTHAVPHACCLNAAPPTHVNSAHSPCCWPESTHQCHMQGMGENQGSLWPGALAAACHNMAGAYVHALCRHGLLPHMTLGHNCLRVAGRCNQAVVGGMPSTLCAWPKQPRMRSRATCDCLTWRWRHCRPTVGITCKDTSTCCIQPQWLTCCERVPLLVELSQLLFQAW